jgi:hypothetical protein
MLIALLRSRGARDHFAARPRRGRFEQRISRNQNEDAMMKVRVPTRLQERMLALRASVR